MEGDFAAAVEAVPTRCSTHPRWPATPDEVRARFAERWDGVYERTLLWRRVPRDGRVAASSTASEPWPARTDPAARAG